ncbi:ParA family protein [Massilia soli]|uniref:ParA family protein n=1 Tax=Massilia soli TaxID=2792854 RepID=A0ABS7SMS7_9BURK|nr:ParA family protein [Massilia soli]MBZ2207181.1 ParA family protein [Massilia soli]
MRAPPPPSPAHPAQAPRPAEQRAGPRRRPGMTTLVVANQKGGVGKSTTACHAAFYLGGQARAKQPGGADKGRVAFISCEVQKNSSNTLKKTYGTANVRADAFFRSEPFDVVPTGAITVYEGGPFMADIERIQGAHFRTQVARIAPHFDYCIIDTPPSVGVLQVAALSAADFVLSPIEMDEYSVEGVVDMLKTIIGVKERFNPGLVFLGMLPCRLQNTSPRQKAPLANLLKHYSNYVFGLDEGCKTSVRQAIPEALAQGVPVWQLKSSGAREAGAEMLAIMRLLERAMGR